MRKTLTLFQILMILLLVPALAGAIEVGKPAPGFTIKALDGRAVSLADFRGQVVVLKLATTWCPTCAQLSRELAAAGDFLRDKDVALVEVFLQDTPEMVARYFEGKSFAMPHHVLLDDDMQAYRGYGIYLIPRLLVVDREQKVRYDNGPGAAIPTAEQIVKAVEGAL